MHDIGMTKSASPSKAGARKSFHKAGSISKVSGDSTLMRRYLGGSDGVRIIPADGLVRRRSKSISHRWYNCLTIECRNASAKRGRHCRLKSHRHGRVTVFDVEVASGRYNARSKAIHFVRWCRL